MSKIVLDVDNKNKETVLMILNNLKHGLIKNISIDNKVVNTNLETKKAVKKAVLEDEFLSSQPSTGKYLSRSSFKEKLLSIK